MGFWTWLKGIFMYADTVNRLKSYEERLRKMEIEHAAMKTSLNIIENSVELRLKKNKK